MNAKENLSWYRKNIKKEIIVFIRIIIFVGSPLLIIGLFMNFIVIKANGEKMPFFSEYRDTEERQQVSEETKYPFLCDWINITPNSSFLLRFLLRAEKEEEEDEDTDISPGDILIWIAKRLLRDFLWLLVFVLFPLYVMICSLLGIKCLIFEND